MSNTSIQFNKIIDALAYCFVAVAICVLLLVCSPLIPRVICIAGVVITTAYLIRKYVGSFFEK